LRHAAVRALKVKPSPAAKQVLLDAFGYPCPAFADFASEALVALGAKDVKNALVDLLDMPNPHRVQADRDARPVVREVVRVNQARNCQLCHAPSWKSSTWPAGKQSFPHRYAVLRTLRALTGHNFGDRADDWRKELSGAAAGGEKGRG
jgi:hypothetical protein